jgi:hypothetical protein
MSLSPVAVWLVDSTVGAWDTAPMHAWSKESTCLHALDL